MLRYEKVFLLKKSFYGGKQPESGTSSVVCITWAT